MRVSVGCTQATQELTVPFYFLLKKVNSFLKGSFSGLYFSFRTLAEQPHSITKKPSKNTLKIQKKRPYLALCLHPPAKTKQN